jgi:hypothetical protein
MTKKASPKIGTELRSYGDFNPDLLDPNEDHVIGQYGCSWLDGRSSAYWHGLTQPDAAP